MAYCCKTLLSVFSTVHTLSLRLDVRITTDVILSKDTKLFLELPVLASKGPDLVGLLYDVVATAVDYDKLAFTRCTSSAARVAWLSPITLIVM